MAAERRVTQLRRTAQLGCGRISSTTGRRVNSGVDWLARLGQNFAFKQMVVTTEYVDISLPASPMRTFVAAPRAEGQYPGIWCYSDIFQLTPPLLRTCVRLAGYGFVAAAPEIYRRIEPPGTVIPFDDAGR